MPKILIADDNKQISSILREYAYKENYDVFLAYDGEEALEQFELNHPDIILLDVMMPKKDGFEVCREIRSKSTVPIIMVTARGEDFERIMGLDIGADDYIVKPFSPGEVMARVRAVLRRMVISKPDANNAALNSITISNLFIDMNKYEVTIDAVPIPLTKKEMEILWLMAQRPGHVYSRDKLLDIIWGYDYYGDNRTVDSHIKRLRAKLDTKPHPNWNLITIWGVGYKFEVHDENK